jgi:hypothetical protein
MKNIDQILVTDCELYLINESAFYVHWFTPYEKLLKKQINKGAYIHEKAVNGLQERIRRFFKSCDNDNICRYTYKYRPIKYSLNKQERIAVASEYLKRWELDNL